MKLNFLLLLIAFYISKVFGVYNITNASLTVYPDTV